MALVAGADFGTQSVRVAVVDSERGPIGSGVASYPVNRKADDPDYATQSHERHMEALTEATRQAINAAGVSGKDIEAFALDTTGSTIIPVDENFQILDDYYLWCDHRAYSEAALITETAHRTGLAALDWCGGIYSSEWGFSKLLHWLRHNPGKRDRLSAVLEHCDMVAATLCGIRDPLQAPRSICAMGHKWMWNRALGGLPPEDFLVQVDPLFKGVRERLAGRYAGSDTVAGGLSDEWASRLGLRAGIPIPTGAFDAHWDAVGAGCRPGDVVNVVGTSTCIMAIAPKAALIPGVCGVVQGSIHPSMAGIEAGLSATGDIFEAIARRAGTSVAEASRGLDAYEAGQTGLLRLTWDNGDRTVLVNPELGGVTLGWTLQHSAKDELFAAIEGTAFHTRVILERMAEHGVPIERVINGGGIPQKNTVLNRVYADVLGKPVLVPETPVTSLGSAIFAFLAAGVFKSIEDAQAKLCPKYITINPRPEVKPVYDELYHLWRSLYFGFGSRDAEPVRAGGVLPALRRIAREAKAKVNAVTVTA